MILTLKFYDVDPQIKWCWPSSLKMLALKSYDIDPQDFMLTLTSYDIDSQLLRCRPSSPMMLTLKPQDVFIWTLIVNHCILNVHWCTKLKFQDDVLTEAGGTIISKVPALGTDALVFAVPLVQVEALMFALTVSLEVGDHILSILPKVHIHILSSK